MITQLNLLLHHKDPRKFKEGCHASRMIEALIELDRSTPLSEFNTLSRRTSYKNTYLAFVGGLVMLSLVIRLPDQGSKLDGGQVGDLVGKVRLQEGPVAPAARAGGGVWRNADLEEGGSGCLLG